MDRELFVISNALTDTRVHVAQRFEQLTTTTERRQLAYFMLAYCRQASVLVGWMSEWSKQLGKLIAPQGKTELAALMGDIADKLLQRHQALTIDVAHLSRWMQTQFPSCSHFANEEVVISSGMKQLRFVAQECIKRSHGESWLLIITELERLRIVHGFTLIKLCDIHFGHRMLRCFSHIHYQHQHQNELFGLCEHALKSQIKLQDASITSMIAEVKTAIDAYASFISDCYSLGLRWVKYDKSTIN